jgi:hypothetical protein
MRCYAAGYEVDIAEMTVLRAYGGRIEAQKVTANQIYECSVTPSKKPPEGIRTPADRSDSLKNGTYKDEVQATE